MELAQDCIQLWAVVLMVLTLEDQLPLCESVSVITETNLVHEGQNIRLD
jgi:hypothetical protein